MAMPNMTNILLESEIKHFLEEDGLLENMTYLQGLPSTKVHGQVFIKSDLVLAGVPYFNAVFNFLGVEGDLLSLEIEGGTYSKGTTFSFELPFNVALSGERLALNLLHHASRVATTTKSYVDKVEGHGIKILDTRKTTPGLRTLEKYAVRIGGGENHRFSQTDVWMIKDNHKQFFGGLKKAVDFFKKSGGFYRPIVCEVHTLEELAQATELGLTHLMLDNFSPEGIKRAIQHKEAWQTYEVSGGVRLSNISEYCIEGVDAISTSQITSQTQNVDISFKYE